MDNEIKKDFFQKKFNSSGLAFASLVMGLVGMMDIFLPFMKSNGDGNQLFFLGLLFGIWGINSAKRNFAIIGIVLCFVGEFVLPFIFK